MTGDSRADKWELDDERILHRCQDNPKVAVLAPSMGTLNQRRVYGEDKMRVLDGRVVWFTQLLGKCWGLESIYNGVNLHSVRHILFIYLPTVEVIRLLARRLGILIPTSSLD